MTGPLTLPEIEARLDEALDPVLTSQRRSAPLAAALSRCSRTEQQRVLDWADVIAKTNAELAYRFVQAAPVALTLLDANDVEAWVIQAMDVYDRLGLHPACAIIDDVEHYSQTAREFAQGVSLEQVAPVLELFLRGLSGRSLALTADDTTFTDTETLHLPARIARYPDRDANFRLYKATAAHLWAQTWYGTFRVPLRTSLALYPDPQLALRLFHALETLRLDACLARDLPGLHRELMALRAQDGGALPEHWRAHTARLEAPDANVGDTLAAVAALYPESPPMPTLYQGALQLDVVEKTTSARHAREKMEFQAALAQLLPLPPNHETGETDGQRVRVEADGSGVRDAPSLTVDGKRVAVPSATRALMGSIAQDFGRIPDDYLQPLPLQAAGEAAGRALDLEEEDGVPYDEWDYRRGHYRKAWCTVRDVDVTPVDAPFVADTLRKYAGLVARLRKTFEALREDHRLERRQLHGEDLDLDALIEARVDLRGGRELGERLFLRTHRIARDIAVMFMVDMSGSTKGWINEAERESLVLLCEALEVLGDRYAIYGFSGITRKRCEVYRVKRFAEAYDATVKRRIAGIAPQDYTRMGAAIRHLGQMLRKTDARTKLLITLSDGRPDDYDGYRGDYGIEDTRQALFEIKRSGIQPFCITIDTDARDYLPHLYGAANYTVIDDVRRLPYRVADVYRRLTG